MCSLEFGELFQSFLWFLIWYANVRGAVIISDLCKLNISVWIISRTKLGFTKSWLPLLFEILALLFRFQMFAYSLTRHSTFYVVIVSQGMSYCVSIGRTFLSLIISSLSLSFSFTFSKHSLREEQLSAYSIASFIITKSLGFAIFFSVGFVVLQSVRRILQQFDDLLQLLRLRFCGFVAFAGFGNILDVSSDFFQVRDRFRKSLIYLLGLVVPCECFLAVRWLKRRS